MKKINKPEEPIVVQSPIEGGSSSFLDSSAYIITVSSKGFGTIVNEKLLVFDSFKKLESRLKEDSSFLQKNRIVIRATPNAPYNKIKKVVEFLNDSGYMRFNLLTTKAVSE